jgi:hypothetical protein
MTSNGIHLDAELMEQNKKLLWEIAPGVEPKVLEQILIDNHHDLDHSINAVLTYLRILEIETEEKLHIEQPNHFEIHNKDHHQSWSPVVKSLEVNQLPRFRLVMEKETQCEKEFKIIYRRDKAKIGLNIDLVGGFIQVTSLPKSDEHGAFLAEESGVRENDMIIGFGTELFAPYPDKQDVVKLLETSIPFTTIHFLREKPTNLNIMLSHSHSFTRYLWQQSMIDYTSIRLVNMFLFSLKNKVLSWNLTEIRHQIDAFSPKSQLTQKFFDSKAFIRPGLVTRILRVEFLPQSAVASYVIWVSDVETGWEWIVKRSFKEILRFREVSQN